LLAFSSLAIPVRANVLQSVNGFRFNSGVGWESNLGEAAFAAVGQLECWLMFSAVSV